MPGWTTFCWQEIVTVTYHYTPTRIKRFSSGRSRITMPSIIYNHFLFFVVPKVANWGIGVFVLVEHPTKTCSITVLWIGKLDLHSNTVTNGWKSIEFHANKKGITIVTRGVLSVTSLNKLVFPVWPILFLVENPFNMYIVVKIELICYQTLQIFFVQCS